VACVKSGFRGWSCSPFQQYCAFPAPIPALSQQVDDGLELRKAAFEALELLLDSGPCRPVLLAATLPPALAPAAPPAQQPPGSAFLQRLASGLA
jgi:hypothetical protein